MGKPVRQCNQSGHTAVCAARSGSWGNRSDGQCNQSGHTAVCAARSGSWGNRSDSQCNQSGHTAVYAATRALLVNTQLPSQSRTHTHTHTCTHTHTYTHAHTYTMPHSLCFSLCYIKWGGRGGREFLCFFADLFFWYTLILTGKILRNCQLTCTLFVVSIYRRIKNCLTFWTLNSVCELQANDAYCYSSAVLEQCLPGFAGVVVSCPCFQSSLVAVVYNMWSWRQPKTDDYFLFTSRWLKQQMPVLCGPDFCVRIAYLIHCALRVKGTLL